MFMESDVVYQPAALPCWELKTVAESHTCRGAAQSVERSEIGSLDQAKAVVISYDLWISRKTE